MEKDAYQSYIDNRIKGVSEEIEKQKAMLEAFWELKHRYEGFLSAQERERKRLEQLATTGG